MVMVNPVYIAFFNETALFCKARSPAAATSEPKWLSCRYGNLLLAFFYGQFSVSPKHQIIRILWFGRGRKKRRRAGRVRG
jgi:hypothetical protein